MNEELESNSNNVAKLLAAGSALADGKHFDINDTPAVLVPEGYRVQTFEDHREDPLRIEQHVSADTAAAFCTYIQRFGDDGSAIFAHLGASSFTAILDYHLPPAQPNWCRHKVTYTCPHSKEWETWSKKSGVQMNQAQFAEFIEDNLVDIVQPNGAEMLEVAKTLDARSNVRFKSAIRLDNGETQLVYEEVIDGAAGAKGQIKIPQTITLALRVFQGEDPYAVEARFKYRIKEGALTMWYEMIRPHRIVEDAFSGILARIRDYLKEIPVYEATAL